MSSYEKVVKGATKPKPGGIKPKYVDPIIATTFSNDGSLQAVCRALGPRLREPNSIIVYKALILIHTMIRNGDIDNVMSHLSPESGNIRLKNVSNGPWAGNSSPQSLSAYSRFLEERVRAYRELKHDVIRTGERSRDQYGATNSNRLRKLTVEKGLLREVSITQKVANTILDCSFFLDDLNDDLTMAAFRMTLKDLLALFTAINEGVINILEHYFEMAKTDAGRALELYRRFCRQTEKVVAYLNSARRAALTLNVVIPNLKHAPVSLAGALQEYLNDPNFEQNRKEYKENKRIADGTSPRPSAATTTTSSTVPTSDSKKNIAVAEPQKPANKPIVKPPTNNQAIQDFFTSIENQPSNAFSNLPAEQAFFVQAQPTGMGTMGMGTGMGMGTNAAFANLQPQMTGFNPFIQGQATGMYGPQPTGFAPGNQGGAAFGMGLGVPSQQTGSLQAQATGFNPFRQSQLMAQPTGFGGGGPFATLANQGNTPQSSLFFGQPNQQSQPAFQQQQSQQVQPQATGFMSNSASSNSILTNGAYNSNGNQNNALVAFNSAFGNSANPSTSANKPDGSASSAFSFTQSTTPKPLLSQKTGSRNPFAPPPGSTPPASPPPPVPKGLTLSQLAMGAFSNGGGYGLGANGWDGTNPLDKTQTQQQQLKPQPTGLIGSVASEFTLGRANHAASPAPSTTATNISSQFDSLSVASTAPSSSATQLQPQPTGFGAGGGGGGVQPFRPETNFGASLFTNSMSTSGSLGAQPTGNPFAARIGSPQPVSNYTTTTSPPVKSATLPLTSSSFSSFNNTSSVPLTAQPTGFGGIKPFVPSSDFGRSILASNNNNHASQEPNLLQF